MSCTASCHGMRGIQQPLLCRSMCICEYVFKKIQHMHIHGSGKSADIAGQRTAAAEIANRQQNGGMHAALACL